MEEIKLHQVIATEKGVKTRVYAFLSETYKMFQKPQLFTGFTKTYNKKNADDPEDFPDETVRVQQNARELLKEIGKNLTEYMDVVANKDWANKHAEATIKIDGEVFLEKVPAPYLLFLEKQLNDIKSEIDKLPELDPAHEWTEDPNSRLYRSKEKTTTKTRKVHEVVKKFEPTEHQPGQAEIIYVDKTVGTYTQTQISGAIPIPLKRELQERTTKLIKAVKYARTEANEIKLSKQEIGAKIFKYLLG